MHQYNIIPLNEKPDFSTNNLFISTKWLSVLQKTYGFEFYYFTLKNRSKEVVIPFSVVNNLKGSYIVSLPFSDYLGANHIEKELYLVFLNYLKNNYSGYPVILKTTYQSFYNFSTVRYACYHVIDLKKKQSCSAAFLRGVRKANINGLVVKHDNTFDGLNTFYKLYSNLRISKFKSIPQPFDFFKNIFEVFIKRGLGEIILVLYKSEAIAALIALKSNNTLFYKFGASNSVYLHLRPNNLLFYHLKQFALSQNYDSIDLGLSGMSDNYKGLRRFKESMGGELKSINYYRINPQGFDNAHEQKVTAILSSYTGDLVKQNLSLSEIDKISQLIYKNFA